MKRIRNILILLIGVLVLGFVGDRTIAWIGQKVSPTFLLDRKERFQDRKHRKERAKYQYSVIEYDGRIAEDGSVFWDLDISGFVLKYPRFDSIQNPVVDRINNSIEDHVLNSLRLLNSEDSVNHFKDLRSFFSYLNENHLYSSDYFYKLNEPIYSSDLLINLSFLGFIDLYPERYASSVYQWSSVTFDKASGKQIGLNEILGPDFQEVLFDLIQKGDFREFDRKTGLNDRIKLVPYSAYKELKYFRLSKKGMYIKVGNTNNAQDIVFFNYQDLEGRVKGSKYLSEITDS